MSRRAIHAIHSRLWASVFTSLFVLFAFAAFNAAYGQTYFGCTTAPIVQTSWSSNAARPAFSDEQRHDATSTTTEGYFSSLSTTSTSNGHRYDMWFLNAFPAHEAIKLFDNGSQVFDFMGTATVQYDDTSLANTVTTTSYGTTASGKPWSLKIQAVATSASNWKRTVDLNYNTNALVIHIESHPVSPSPLWYGQGDCNVENYSGCGVETFIGGFDDNVSFTGTMTTAKGSVTFNKGTGDYQHYWLGPNTPSYAGSETWFVGSDGNLSLIALVAEDTSGATEIKTCRLYYQGNNTSYPCDNVTVTDTNYPTQIELKATYNNSDTLDITATSYVYVRDIIPIPFNHLYWNITGTYTIGGTSHAFINGVGASELRRNAICGSCSSSSCPNYTDQ